MSQNKQITPFSVVMLTVGTVAALGLAYWSISNAMAPDAVPAKPGVTSVTLPPSGAATATSSPGAEPVGNRHAAPSEAELAHNADPFVNWRATQPLSGNGVGAGMQGNLPSTALPTISDLGPGATRSGNTGPTMAPAHPVSVMPMSVASRSVSPLPPEPTPQLAGTMLGDRSCAVFREDQALRVVAVGDTFQGWRVVSVTHGDAVVRKGKRTVHLEVGYGDVSTHKAAVTEAPPAQNAGPTIPSQSTPIP